MGTESTPAYIPGVCNINQAEIKSRRNAGHLGLALFVGVLAILLFSGIDRYYRIVLFVPAFLAAIGYLQARNKFCVGYGAAGLQNATDGSTTANAITDKKALGADKRKTRDMNTQAFLLAVIITLATCLLPSL